MAAIKKFNSLKINHIGAATNAALKQIEARANGTEKSI